MQIVLSQVIDGQWWYYIRTKVLCHTAGGWQKMADGGPYDTAEDALEAAERMVVLYNALQ
jgi:hypothetical protein